jgi:hypothetical protein
MKHMEKYGVERLKRPPQVENRLVGGGWIQKSREKRGHSVLRVMERGIKRWKAKSHGGTKINYESAHRVECFSVDS